MAKEFLEPAVVREAGDSARWIADTPAGRLLLRGQGPALRAIEFGGASESGNRGSQDLLARAEEQLLEYFGGGRRTFDLPLAPQGTQFQLAVWRALLAIPYGSTETYAELAARVGRPRAVRAAGAANGANPLPIVIPCHRVIGADGRLTGYGGGIEVKRRLLQLEGVLRPRLGTSPGLFPAGEGSAPGQAGPAPGASGGR